MTLNGQKPENNGEPRLLDVVPWSYGFAHSWALRALLSRIDIAERTFAAADNLSYSRPLIIEGEIARDRDVIAERAPNHTPALIQRERVTARARRRAHTLVALRAR